MKWVLTILSWLLSLFASRVAAKNEGKAEAEREHTQAVTAAVAQANDARAGAEKAHGDDSDAAFDQEFRRP